MATIFMNVQNEQVALETLLYVFRNQMILGRDNLTLTLKHKDGYRDFSIGDINKVFKSDLINEIEYHDMILLEHFNIGCYSHIQLGEEIDSLGTLVDMGKDIDSCCHFIIPKGNNLAYFLIKNHPMYGYIIYRNDIISDKLIGSRATSINNIGGKIRSEAGVIAMLSTFSR